MKRALYYEAEIVGLFGRNRKPQRETIKLARREEGDPLPDAEAVTLANAALAKIRFRHGTVRVAEQTVECRRFDNGVVIETWLCRGGRTIAKGVSNGGPIALATPAG